MVSFSASASPFPVSSLISSHIPYRKRERPCQRDSSIISYLSPFFLIGTIVPSFHSLIYFSLFHILLHNLHKHPSNLSSPYFHTSLISYPLPLLYPLFLIAPLISSFVISRSPCSSLSPLIPFTTLSSTPPNNF